MVSLRFLLLIVALVLLIVRAMVLLSSYAITCNIDYVQYRLRAILIACNIDCVQLLKYSKGKAWQLPLHLFRNIGL